MERHHKTLAFKLVTSKGVARRVQSSIAMLGSHSSTMMRVRQTWTTQPMMRCPDKSDHVSLECRALWKTPCAFGKCSIKQKLEKVDTWLTVPQMPPSKIK
jgi:hypothetical protein